MTAWLDGQSVLAHTLPAGGLTAGKVGVRSAASAARVDEILVRL